MMHLETGAKSVGRKHPGRVPGEAESLGDRFSKKRIAERSEHEEQGGFGHMMFLVAGAQLGNERAEGIEDRIQRLAVPRKDHPGGERSRAFPPEGVECHVDDVARIGFPGTGPFDGLCYAAGDSFRDRPREFGLKSRCRAEMVEQIGVSPANLRGDGFQRDCLWAVRHEEGPRRLKGGGPALFGVETFAPY